MKASNTYFDMSNENHKKILIEEVEDILSIIGKLPLHPKHKLNLYNRYLLSKILWHLTTADLTETWVKEVLDNKCHNTFQRWLEIPANGTVDTRGVSELTDRWGCAILALEVVPKNLIFT